LALSASSDLFISYRWADRSSVAPLIAALRARGVRVWQDSREVEDFASIQQAVGNGLAGARALLAWYSGRYNESRACQWELTAAYCAGQAEGDPLRRILVVNPESANAHIHLPELFDQLHLSDRYGPAGPRAVEELADRIHAALYNTVPDRPLGELRALTPPRWLPSMGTGSTRFVGRLPQMWELHGKLVANQAAMLTGTGGKPSVALLRGAGGAGKSLLAEEYALRFGAAYPGGVFWVRAYGHPDGGAAIQPAQRATLRDAQMLDLARGLGIDTRELESAQVRAAMARHFELDAQPFLWVVDDLPSDLGTESLGDWLAPHALGRTLLTSRTRRFTHVPTLDLPHLGPDEARGLLTRRSSVTADVARAAEEICATLGYHALAVDVTAALVDRRGLDGTLKALKRSDQDVLELAAHFEEALPNGHQRNIAATFLASIRQLDEQARNVLRLAVALAAAPIPRLLLARGLGAVAGLEDNDAQDQADLAIDRLLSSSLVDGAGKGAISVHTLVSRTMRFADGSSDAPSMWREHVVHVLTKEMEQASNIRKHAHLEPWVEHARELSASGDDVATVDLLGWVARYDFERAAYSLARSGYELELDIRKRKQGGEHPDTLVSMSNLAGTLMAQGDLAGARRLRETALEICKRVLGEEHPATLTSMNNLASTLRAQGDLPGARSLEETALGARERVLSEEHPDRLRSMINLASTLSAHGDLPGARRLEEAALEISKRVLGEEHPDTLASMVNLASTLYSQGDLPGARQLQETALEISKRVLGEEHPHTLTSMGNLASTLSIQGDLPGARRLKESVLEVRKRVQGVEHPDTLTSTANLAITLKAQGDLTGARGLEETLVQVRRRVLGEEHPDTLTSMNNLATTLWSQGDLGGARRLEEMVLGARKRVLGKGHPDTATSMSSLASTLRAQGDLLGARRLEEAALKVRKSVLGEEHPETLKSMSNLASTLQHQGDLPGARRMQETVLGARRRILGEEHPDTLTSMNNLAAMLWLEGESTKARVLQETVLRARNRAQGEEHPDTLSAMHNLAITLWQRGEPEEARRLQAICVAGFTKSLGSTHPHTRKAEQALTQMGGAARSSGAGEPTWLDRLARWLRTRFRRAP